MRAVSWTSGTMPRVAEDCCNAGSSSRTSTRIPATLLIQAIQKSNGRGMLYAFGSGSMSVPIKIWAFPGLRPGSKDCDRGHRNPPITTTLKVMQSAYSLVVMILKNGIKWRADPEGGVSPCPKVAVCTMRGMHSHHTGTEGRLCPHGLRSSSPWRQASIHLLLITRHKEGS